MSQQETDDELEQIQRARDKDDELNQRAAYYVVDIKDLFGPPPVLTTENPQAFDRILLDLVRSRWPQDFIQKMLVWDIANQVWLDMRYDRHTRYTLERGAQSDFQSLPPRLQGSDNRTQIASALPPDFERMGPDEVEGEAFRDSIHYLQKIDEMKTTNFCRRNVSLQIWRGYNCSSIQPAYVVKKEHEAIAQAAIAERNAKIEKLLPPPADRVPKVQQLPCAEAVEAEKSNVPRFGLL